MPIGSFTKALKWWHAPSPRHLRALLSVCGGCSFGGLGFVLVVCVCVSVSGVLFSVDVCVTCCSFYKCVKVNEYLVKAKCPRASSKLQLHQVGVDLIFKGAVCA